MNMLPIIDLLRTHCGHIPLETSTVVKSLNGTSYPAIWVELSGEDIEQDEFQDTQNLQQVRAYFAVWIAAEIANEETQVDQLHEAMTDVRAALVGRTHTDWTHPIEMTGGEIALVENKLILWREGFQTSYSYESTSGA
jgi:hypothetical protein